MSFIPEHYSLDKRKTAGAERFRISDRLPLRSGAALAANEVWQPWRVLRVLVAGDDAVNAASLVQLTRRVGHTTRTAHDEHSACRLVASLHPDVVLLDLALPLSAECRIARRVRANFPDSECFIIAFANKASESCREKFHAAGIDLLLMKPFDPAVLETLLTLECGRVNQRLESRGYARDEYENN